VLNKLVLSRFDRHLYIYENYLGRIVPPPPPPPPPTPPVLATFTVTLSEAEPPGPLQVRVYVFDKVRFPVDPEPDVGFEPDQSPEAVQDVALVEVHESVEAVFI
jgi:hypothetical protein